MFTAFMHFTFFTIDRQFKILQCTKSCCVVQGSVSSWKSLFNQHNPSCLDFMKKLREVKCNMEPLEVTVLLVVLPPSGSMMLYLHVISHFYSTDVCPAGAFKTGCFVDYELGFEKSENIGHGPKQHLNELVKGLGCTADKVTHCY